MDYISESTFLKVKRADGSEEVITKGILVALEQPVSEGRFTIDAVGVSRSKLPFMLIVDTKYMVAILNACIHNMSDSKAISQNICYAQEASRCNTNESYSYEIAIVLDDESGKMWFVGIAEETNIMMMFRNFIANLSTNTNIASLDAIKNLLDEAGNEYVAEDDDKEQEKRSWAEGFDYAKNHILPMLESGAMAVSYSEEELSAIDRFSKLFGLSTERLERDMYYYYHYIMLQGKCWIPVTEDTGTWDRVISLRSMLKINGDVVLQD
ncbi:hypothetical protein [Butyrivibrio sp. NC3005]|jgi:hypothetical protein|uniref:hypothetical protein n=1 Tax=Butyrivibrio sp. NC3005 TaxID=1280685 RepID=UPI0004026216|nr:hypothetical protein [Butyrivibrio sp. NC3005]